MSDQATQRVFFALWPDEAVRRALADLSQRYASKGGRPVQPQNLHITLVFLGAVGGESRQCLEAAAAQIHGRPFTLLLDQLSWWQRPRVLWTGPRETPAPLLSLVGDLKLACQGCGFEPERRAYRAHLTLARKVRHAHPPDSIEPVSWPVDSFALVKSNTLPSGAEYAVLRTWPLG